MGIRVRVLLFLAGVLLTLVVMGLSHQAINTIRRLEVVETERDQWQRPADVIEALDVKAGSVVVGLGCGSGYFALKLCEAVGPQGKVLAVDIRRLPLVFLWIRAALKRRSNLVIVRGAPDDPRLPQDALDGVLVVNTYHELTHRAAVLDHTFRALRSGGRFVVVDHSESADHGHGIPADSVEDELRRRGFEILGRQDRFAYPPADEPWWIVVARKP